MSQCFNKLFVLSKSENKLSSHFSNNSTMTQHIEKQEPSLDNGSPTLLCTLLHTPTCSTQMNMFISVSLSRLGGSPKTTVIVKQHGYHTLMIIYDMEPVVLWYNLIPIKAVRPSARLVVNFFFTAHALLKQAEQR